jgi:hypothetical protein
MEPGFVALPELVKFGFGHLHEPDALIAACGEATG